MTKFTKKWFVGLVFVSARDDVLKRFRSTQTCSQSKWNIYSDPMKKNSQILED